jgi:hypothetical protein
LTEWLHAQVRLLGLFLLDANDRRPAYGPNPRFQNDPNWRDPLLFYEYFFYEYFHAETGEGLGASHQTGWTALPRRSWRTERVSAQPKLSRRKLARIFRFSLSPIALGQVTWNVSNRSEFAAIRARHSAPSRCWEKERSMNANEGQIITEGNKTAVRTASTGNNVRYVLIGSVALAILAWILVIPKAVLSDF